MLTTPLLTAPAAGACAAAWCPVVAGRKGGLACYDPYHHPHVNHPSHDTAAAEGHACAATHLHHAQPRALR